MLFAGSFELFRQRDSLTGHHWACMRRTFALMKKFISNEDCLFDGSTTTTVGIYSVSMAAAEEKIGSA